MRNSHVDGLWHIDVVCHTYDCAVNAFDHTHVELDGGYVVSRYTTRLRFLVRQVLF